MRNNSKLPVEDSSAAEVSMLLDILLVLHLQVLVVASSSSAEEDESSERDAQQSKGEQIGKIRASISVTVCKTADLSISLLVLQPLFKC